MNQKISSITQIADWKEKTMLAGLIISVCCAVVTFFTQTVFICSAFAALSGVCGLGTLFIHHYESLKKMRECVEDLERQNQSFAAHNQELNSLIVQQKDTVVDLTRENQNLKTEMIKLAVHTNCLNQTSENLLNFAKDLHANLTELKPTTIEIQRTEEKFRSFFITMEKQQAVTKYLMEFISKTSTEQADQLEGGKKIIEQLLSLQKEDTTLQRIKELNYLHQQISCNHDQLANALKSYTDLQVQTEQISTQLSGLQIQYTLENARLQETRQELFVVSSELQKIRSDLQSVLSEHRSLLSEKKELHLALTLQVNRLQKLHAELDFKTT
jgi:chromosome segregation ATPase